MIRSFALMFAAIGIAACNQQNFVNKIAPPAQQDIARGYIDKLRSHDFAAIRKDIDPSLAADFEGGLLDKMAALFPAGAPTSVKIVGANKFSSTTVGTQLNLTFEFQFGEQFLLTNVATKTKDGVQTIVGFRVQPLSRSLEAQNRFTLTNKSALQYGVLIAAVSAALFTLYALVICIKTRLPRRKWLWILFILFGFGKIMVNWTSDAWDFRIVNFQLFSAAAYADYFGPWIVTVALPVGAAIFLIRRRKLEMEPSTVDESAN